ncbi:MAG: hypothetical protein HKL84_03525 [Acidimicrobiaceae bacterium]|nr:hypothetical protein [Acidimicrobiaceae bacterium]
MAILGQAGRPLTVGEVASQAARGSEIGIRKSLARLVTQGIVRATVMGRNRVHELNRDHVAAPIAVLLAGLRNELWRKFREEFGSWDPKPLLATVFGSAARHDGGTDSDIDLLLVHPAFPGEKPQVSSKQSVLDTALGVISVLADGPATPPNPSSWHRQVDILRGRVQTWTGNRLQVVDLSYFEWLSPAPSTKGLLDEVGKAKVELFSQFPLLGFR